jgi:hypothetical protein
LSSRRLTLAEQPPIPSGTVRWWFFTVPCA